MTRKAERRWDSCCTRKERERKIDRSNHPSTRKRKEGSKCIDKIGAMKISCTSKTNKIQSLFNPYLLRFDRKQTEFGTKEIEGDQKSVRSCHAQLRDRPIGLEPSLFDRWFCRLYISNLSITSIGKQRKYRKNEAGGGKKKRSERTNIGIRCKRSRLQSPIESRGTRGVRNLIDRGDSRAREVFSFFPLRWILLKRKREESRRWTILWYTIRRRIR